MTERDESHEIARTHLKEPFHNPYTFIPFPDDQDKPDRAPPTLHSADEEDSARFTGIIELEVTTLSPLMTLVAEPYKTLNEHGFYRALTIGDDVIVPKTAVRGALRFLMTVLYGGSVGYIDEYLQLVGRRDTRLGPRTQRDGNDIPREVFLGRVVEPGSETHPGTIQLGTTKLLELEDLQPLKSNLDVFRPTASASVKSLYVRIEAGRPVSIRETRDPQHNWQLKLSGSMKNKKREGAFKPNDGAPITVPAQLWAEFNGRHRNSVKQSLETDDLVWLEPKSPNATTITSADQIKSLQWARWGRHGRALMDSIPELVHPDNKKLPDADKGFIVDMMTDLFGQLGSRTHAKFGKEPSFAARIQPENLVFPGGRSKLLPEAALAPLCQPHPGCGAFYDDPDYSDLEGPKWLRGFKVYRRAALRAGETPPWLWKAQPIFNGRSPKPEHDKMNKSAELLKEGVVGQLRLAVYSLSQAELACLLICCNLEWRLGGGKPLGLGACRVTVKSVTNELGQPHDGPGASAMKAMQARLSGGIGAWKASQRPLPHVRYPRMAKDKQVGGHVWFNYFTASTPFRIPDAPSGRQQAIDGQILPPLTSNGVGEELYGYSVESKQPQPIKDDRGKVKSYIHRDIGKFEPGK